MQKTDELLNYGRNVLEQQPFSRMMGTKLTSLSPDLAELRLVIRPELLQQNGFVHGGVLSYLADNVLAFAGGAAMGVPVVTSEFKLNYVRPAVGQELRARASCASKSKSQAVCTLKVFVVADDLEKLCAIGQGTIARLPDAA
ncbi:PaaI family thioesterase [Rhodoferax sp.]|uniref:PaaI family thioesterase n=1 Tax=Rhodoferax sp. TaxID=50421 RepID=UPI002601A6F1|nr:PaaI family thioesterase [Rhodoferax sp.]MDD2926480.1 PaaI family thioesterase [Rhodoferax sp.]